jgi:hypothetical protein
MKHLKSLRATSDNTRQNISNRFMKHKKHKPEHCKTTDGNGESGGLHRMQALPVT